MYGAAPNRSRVGSHVELETNDFNPVWAMVGVPMRQSSATMTAAATRTASPNTVSRIAHARSGALRRAVARPGRRSGSLAGAITSLAGSEDGLSIDGHLLQRLLHLLHHGFRQGRVVERGRLLLSFVLGPP